MKNIKVVKMPGVAVEVTVEADANIERVLEVAEISAEGYQIKLNGNSATTSEGTDDGDRVVLTKMIKGNSANFVKVVKMPGMASEVAVEDGATVEDALGLADLSVDGYQVKVNGSTATVNTEIHDGDRVVLTKMIKGNSELFVKVVKMPGITKDVALEDGATVRDALEIAELSSEGHQIKKNGNTASLEEAVEDGDRVILTKMIKGNK